MRKTSEYNFKAKQESKKGQVLPDERLVMM